MAKISPETLQPGPLYDPVRAAGAGHGTVEDERGWLLMSYWPTSNLHSAPPPAFFMISFGSIVHSTLEMLSTIDPAAPSGEAPAVRAVALTSFASRPVKARLRSRKVRSQVPCGNINIASSANNGICRDRNRLVGRKAEIGPTAEQSSDYSLIKSSAQIQENDFAVLLDRRIKRHEAKLSSNGEMKLIPPIEVKPSKLIRRI